MNINWDNVMATLEIMGKGMLGIFATIIIVMIVVFLLSKTGKKKDAEYKFVYYYFNMPTFSFKY